MYGLACSEVGENEKAIRIFNAIIASDPDFSAAYHNRGIAFKELGDYESSILDLNKAISLTPDAGRSYMRRGEIFRILSRIDEAVKDFNKYLELSGNEYGDAEEIRQMIRDLGYEPEY